MSRMTDSVKRCVRVAVRAEVMESACMGFEVGGGSLL